MGSDRDRRGGKKSPVGFVLPPGLMGSVRAAAAVLGFSERQIVEGGVVLYCTYVLNRLAPGLERRGQDGKERPNWESAEVVSALASSFVSVRKRRRGLGASQSGKARVSEIGSVGSVLRSLAGSDGKGKS